VRHNLDVNIQFCDSHMLSQTVEYALRAVVQLAYLSPEASTTSALATVTQVPPAYLAKVLRALVKAGIVSSQRGIGGGVSLAKDPRAVTILDIVNAVDPFRRIKTCPLELSTHGTKLCPLHRRLDAALAQVEHAFRNTTLAEVLADPSKVKPLCEVDRTRKQGRRSQLSR
jgi:Rrf2 family protein